jgi:hypothetical protein
MLQIARGMDGIPALEKIYHGDLNPSNVLVSMRGTPTRDTHLHVKGRRVRAVGDGRGRDGA